MAETEGSYIMALKEGMEVEVHLSEKNKGFWAEGILRAIKKGFYKINLKKSLMGNENSVVKIKKFIRDREKSLVEVSLGDVRPIPPHRQFPLHFLDGLAIEVKETNCWLPGFIVRQVPCECAYKGHKLWLVSFPHTNILEAYPLTQLRPAQKWQEGKWTLIPRNENLQIKQVIRVLSAKEVSKSSSQPEVSQGSGQLKRSRVEEVKAIEVSQGPGQVKRSRVEEVKAIEVIEIEDDVEEETEEGTRVEEEKQEAMKAKEVIAIEDDVEEGTETGTRVEEEKQQAMQAKEVIGIEEGVWKKFHARKHHFSMRQF